MHNESRCDGCGLKLAYLMLTFKKADLTSLAENCIREILPLPFSLVINVYLLVFLIFIHLLRYKMFLWRTLGQSVLSLCEDVCGIMWWANTFGCIQVLLQAFLEVNTSSVVVFSPVFWSCYWKPAYRPWLFTLSSLHIEGMTDKQVRNS